MGGGRGGEVEGRDGRSGGRSAGWRPADVEVEGRDRSGRARRRGRCGGTRRRWVAPAGTSDDGRLGLLLDHRRGRILLLHHGLREVDARGLLSALDVVALECLLVGRFPARLSRLYVEAVRSAIRRLRLSPVCASIVFWLIVDASSLAISAIVPESGAVLLPLLPRTQEPVRPYLLRPPVTEEPAPIRELVLFPVAVDVSAREVFSLGSWEPGEARAQGQRREHDRTHLGGAGLRLCDGVSARYTVSASRFGDVVGARLTFLTCDGAVQGEVGVGFWRVFFM